MKKLSMYIMLAIAGWSLTACDESFDDWTKSAVYTQEAGVQITGFSATPTAAAASVIDLGTMAKGDEVQLFNFVQGTLPAGVKLENIRLEAKPADQPAATAAKVAASEDGKVTKEELENLVYAFYSKKSTVRTFDAGLFANAVKGTEAQLITLGSFTLQIKPEAVENPYYYVWGTITAQDPLVAYKTVMTPDPENETKFTFTTKYVGAVSAIWGNILVWNSKYWGEATNNGTTKPTKYTKLYCATTVNPKDESGDVIQDKLNYFASPTKEFYTFSIDLDAMKYEWIKLEDQNPASYNKISLIGVNGDWSTDMDMEAVEKAKHNWFLENVTVTTADTQVKFRANAAWDTAWGFGTADGEWSVNDDNWAKPCTTSGKNIAVPAGKYNVYFCDITGAAHFVPVE